MRKGRGGSLAGPASGPGRSGPGLRATEPKAAKGGAASPKSIPTARIGAKSMPVMSPAIIWKNDRLGKSGYPGISQYKFSKMGSPRITWDKFDENV